jgi:AhpD family alkylhydroperoxidase
MVLKKKSISTISTFIIILGMQTALAGVFDLLVMPMKVAATTTCAGFVQALTYRPSRFSVKAMAALEYGHVGPISELAKASYSAYAGFWMLIRSSIIEGKIQRHHMEAIAVLISTLNKCQFCTDAHSEVVKMIKGVSGRDMEAIREGEVEGISDLKLRNLAIWAQWLKSPTSSLPVAPITPLELAEIRGIFLTFSIANSIMDQYPQKSADGLSEGPLGAALGVAMAIQKAIPRIPGQALPLLPRGNLRPDQPGTFTENMTESLGRALTAVSQEANKLIPPQVLEYLTSVASSYDGSPLQFAMPQPEAFKELAQRDQHLARFLVYSGLASNRLVEQDQPTWQEVRHRFSEEDLRTLSFWSSLSFTISHLNLTGGTGVLSNPW